MDASQNNKTVPIAAPAVEGEHVLTEIEKELKTRFELLPKDIQDMIVSDAYQQNLFETAKKYKLTYEQLGQLEMEATMVLLGMTPPDELQDDLQHELNISSVDAGFIVSDIKEQSFKQVWESLMKLYNKKGIPITTSPLLGQKEETILEKSGIEILSDAEAVSEEGTLVKGALEKGIENPPKVEPRVLNPIPTPTPQTSPKITLHVPVPPTKPNNVPPVPVPSVTENPPVKPVPPKSAQVQSTFKMPNQQTSPTQTPNTPPTSKPVGDPYREPLQ